MNVSVMNTSLAMPRRFRGKLLHYHTAWTTKAEAIKAQNHEKKQGCTTTIKQGWKGNKGLQTKVYVVYSAYKD